MKLEYVKVGTRVNKEQTCIYNDGCKCLMKTCWKCGWNPKVNAKRMEKLKAVYGYE